MLPHICHSHNTTHIERERGVEWDRVLNPHLLLLSHISSTVVINAEAEVQLVQMLTVIEQWIQHFIKSWNTVLVYKSCLSFSQIIIKYSRVITYTLPINYNKLNIRIYISKLCSIHIFYIKEYRIMNTFSTKSYCKKKSLKENTWNGKILRPLLCTC